MDNRLKCCPYCRSGDLRVEEDWVPDNDGGGAYKNFVICNTCGARSCSVLAEESAITAWNELATACEIYKKHDADLRLNEKFCPICQQSLNKLAVRFDENSGHKAQIFCRDCGFSGPYAEPFFKTATEAAFEEFDKIANWIDETRKHKHE